MTSLALIPALPLLGFLVNGLLGRRLPRSVVSLVGCLLPALAFVLTVIAFRQLATTGVPLQQVLFNWAATDGFSVDAAFYFDAVSAVMCLVITGIGTLIHVYSIGYMHGDAGYRPLFRLPQPVPVLHAAAGPRPEPRGDVRRLGRRRARLLPADRLLVPGPGQDRGRTQGLRRQPRRRHRLPAGDVPDLVLRGDARLPGGQCLFRRDAARRRHDDHDRRAAAGRRLRQVGADPAARLVAGRDGRPDAGLRADPCRHHGDRRRLPAVAAERAVPRRARRDEHRRLAGRADRAGRRDHGRDRSTT